MKQVNKEDYMDALKRLGICRGNQVLVHSSLKSFGYIDGGAATLIDGLVDLVGPEGIAAFPSFTGSIQDGSDHPPCFDVRNTPSVPWVGIVPETARRRSGALRSCHPTHSVTMFGDKAERIAESHILSESPCDRYSPFYRLAESGGYILLIGVDFNSNTTIHTGEELAGVPYHLQEDISECRVIDQLGKTHIIKNRLHNWNKPPTDFNKIEPMLLEKGMIRETHCGSSRIRLIPSMSMLEILVATLKDDPYFLTISS